MNKNNKNCVISFGAGFYCIKEKKGVTHNVTNIFVDSISHMVKVTIQKGLSVDAIQMTMENAERIGFINVKALKDYCK